MNNWYFRIAIHEQGKTAIRCEHPTMAGVVGGGWMPRMKGAFVAVRVLTHADEGHDILHPVFGTEVADAAKPKPVKPPADISMIKEGVTRVVTKAELEAHNKHEEPWFVVNGQVYDGTAFLKGHPGGAESIQLVAGEDASEDFMAIHSSDAKLQLRDFHIGSLEGAEEERAQEKVEEEAIASTFLHKSKWRPAKLVEKKKVSHDSRLYRFALQSEEQELGLPCGQHVYARLKRKEWAENGSFKHGDQWVQRAYTPVSPHDAKGFIDMLIKVYLPSGKFIGGRMTVGFVSERSVYADAHRMSSKSAIRSISRVLSAVSFVLDPVPRSGVVRSVNSTSSVSSAPVPASLRSFKSYVVVSPIRQTRRLSSCSIRTRNFRTSSARKNSTDIIAYTERREQVD